MTTQPKLLHRETESKKSPPRPNEQREGVSGKERKEKERKGTIVETTFSWVLSECRTTNTTNL